MASRDVEESVIVPSMPSQNIEEYDGDNKYSLPAKDQAQATVSVVEPADNFPDDADDKEVVIVQGADEIVTEIIE